MKVLITGATGLVGSKIIQLCHDQKIAVNYLTTSKKKIIDKGFLKGFYWNPPTYELDTACFDGVTAIINLAGASVSRRWTSSYKNEILSSRIESLKTLYLALEQIDHSKITSFVSASAIGIYPNSLTAYHTEEESAVDDSFLGEVVKAWEREVDLFQSFNFKVAIVRTGLVLSRKGGALPEMEKPITRYVGTVFGSGEQWQSWIHIEDIGQIFMFVIKQELWGVYNAVAPNPVTNNRLVKEIAEVLKKPLILPKVPEFMMKLLLGEMAYLLFCSQRVCSRKIEEEGFHFNFQNISSALHQLYSKDGRGQRENSTFKEKFI